MPKHVARNIFHDVFSHLLSSIIQWVYCCIWIKFLKKKKSNSLNFPEKITLKETVDCVNRYLTPLKVFSKQDHDMSLNK